MPPSPCVSHEVFRTRGEEAVAYDFRPLPAMRQILDFTLYHLGLARCWAGITAALSSLRMEDLHGRSVVAATPISVAAHRAMMDVFNPPHPCQVTLEIISDSPMFVAAARLLDARARL